MSLEINSTHIFIIRTCKQRIDRITEYKELIPSVNIVYDGIGNPMANMKAAISLQIKSKSNAVYLEDDIILCDNFILKINHEISKRPIDFIQFFSMRKNDIIYGSRYINGSLYLMNQCFYMPLFIAEMVYNSFDEFETNRTDNRVGGTDILIQYVLKKYKLKYWNVVPNLVDHEIGVSAIDKRRSSTNRQSFTFMK